MSRDADLVKAFVNNLIESQFTRMYYTREPLSRTGAYHTPVPYAPGGDNPKDYNHYPNTPGVGIKYDVFHRIERTIFNRNKISIFAHIYDRGVYYKIISPTSTGIRISLITTNYYENDRDMTVTVMEYHPGESDDNEGYVKVTKDNFYSEFVHQRYNSRRLEVLERIFDTFVLPIITPGDINSGFDYMHFIRERIDMLHSPEYNTQPSTYYKPPGDYENNYLIYLETDGKEIYIKEC